jgi:hypothetical protein
VGDKSNNAEDKKKEKKKVDPCKFGSKVISATIDGD